LVLFVTVLLAIGTLLFIGYPLFKKELPEGSFEEGLADDESEKLLSEKDSTLAALKELDFDYETGKLDDEDYHNLRDKYRAKALSLLKEIDEAGMVDKKTSAKRRKKKKAEKSGDSSKLRCPQCGTKYFAGDKFCPGCGQAL
jgi:rubrerythrin